VDVEQLNPQTIWLKLCNNLMDIRLFISYPKTYW